MPALTEVEEETTQSLILRKQESLYRASRKLADEGGRFNRLYPLLWWKPWLYEAAQAVLSNKGSRTPGIDGVTREAFRENLDTELTQLMEELETGTYRPRPVKRVYIPKPGKKEKRPLGIPTIRDRVVQKGVQMILDPICEARFEDCSYGFRPNRSAIQAIREVRHYGQKPRGYEWVIEGDIRNCFGSINHKVLASTLRETIADKRLLGLIWKMLNAGVMEELLYRRTEIGTPQGGIVSPLLANVYMNRLDRWFAAQYHQLSHNQRYDRRKKGLVNARLIRYADDFVVMIRGTREQAEAIKQELAQFIAQDLKMELSEEKTPVTHIRDGFDFLGYTFKVGARPGDGKDGFYCYPSKRAIKEYMRKVKGLTTRFSTLSEVETFYRINLLARGWANYFRYGNSTRTFGYLDYWTWWRAFWWLCKRHDGLGRKEVRARYEAHSSEAVLSWQKKGNYRQLGVPVEGGKLLLERMAAIHIVKYRIAFRDIPGPYQGEPKKQDQPPDTYLPEMPIPPGATRLEPEYQVSRLAALERDGNRCTICGSPIGKETHHWEPRRWREPPTPGVNRPDNLQTLCEECHVRQHLGRTM